MPGEFDLIARHFARLTPLRGDVALGVGDDAALLTPAPGHELVATVDTLIEGVHFFADCPPAALGHKALAVNLSDLAAMGAQPAWALLALAAVAGVVACRLVRLPPVVAGEADASDLAPNTSPLVR